MKCIEFCLAFFFLNVLVSLSADPINSDESSSTKLLGEVIRIIQPGIFDLQSKDYLIRMRAWGVGFPKRGQPGFDEALAFSERRLLSFRPKITTKREFDKENLKVVDIDLLEGAMNFSREAIVLGVGWHLELETGRYGPYLLAQLKAKRGKAGIWANGFNYQGDEKSNPMPTPQLPGILRGSKGFIPGISYWVTSFGRIHRPGCSFYERGRGLLTSKPAGSDCRICGGRTAKKK